jgi:hypothetical protein
MNPSLPEIMVGVVAFAIAFGIAKLISVRKRRRDQQHQQQAAHKAQSRQVRRARERKRR